jgi:hypothetical protein
MKANKLALGIENGEVARVALGELWYMWVVEMSREELKHVYPEAEEP